MALGRPANKLDINFFGHKLGASANMIYWYEAASFPRRRTLPRERAPSTSSTLRARRFMNILWYAASSASASGC